MAARIKPLSLLELCAKKLTGQEKSYQVALILQYDVAPTNLVLGFYTSEGRCRHNGKLNE